MVLEHDYNSDLLFPDQPDEPQAENLPTASRLKTQRLQFRLLSCGATCLRSSGSPLWYWYFKVVGYFNPFLFLTFWILFSLLFVTWGARLLFVVVHFVVLCFFVLSHPFFILSFFSLPAQFYFFIVYLLHNHCSKLLVIIKDYLSGLHSPTHTVVACKGLCTPAHWSSLLCTLALTVNQH